VNKAGLKDVPDIRISSPPGHFTFCVAGHIKIRDFVLSDSGFLQEIIKRYERITTFLKVPLYFLHFQKPAGIPTARTICLSGIFKTYFYLVPFVSASYTPTHVVTVPPGKDSPNYKLTDFDMHTFSLSNLVRNYLFLLSYASTDRTVKNIITMPFGKDSGVYKLTDLSMRTRSLPSLFGNYLYPAKLISAYYKVRNMIEAPSGRDSHVRELTVPNMYWFAKISLSPASRLSSIEKIMPVIHKPNYYYHELSHSFTPVLSESILSSHVDSHNRNISQSKEVVPALTQPVVGIVPFAKPFYLKDGLPRKGSHLDADRMADTEGRSVMTTKDVYSSRDVATNPVLGYIGSKKEQQSNLITVTRARLLSKDVRSNVKNATNLGLVPKWIPGDSIFRASKEVVRHNLIEKGILIRHKRSVDNSQNAQTGIKHRHFDPDIPYVHQRSSPLTYSTDLPAMVYLAPDVLRKSETAVKTTEKDVKRKSSSSVPPPFTRPQMFSSASVAESDVPRLADRVYELIVERLGREKERGGY
jgi:hypothetical protein